MSNFIETIGNFFSPSKSEVTVADIPTATTVNSTTVNSTTKPITTSNTAPVVQKAQPVSSNFDIVKPLPDPYAANTNKEYNWNNNTGNKEYTAMSGADLSVFMLVEMFKSDSSDTGIPNKELIIVEFDNVLSLSFSTIREKFPIRRLGEINPVSFTYGPRSISGHIAFNIFTRDVLSDLRGKLHSDIEQMQSTINAFKLQKSPSNIDKNTLPSNITKVIADIQYKQAYLDEITKNVGSMLLDQLPPFHLLIMGVNERGILSKMMIKNVNIIDENQAQGTTQPNIVNKVYWTATDIIPFSGNPYNKTTIINSLNSISERKATGDYEVVYNMSSPSGSDIMQDLANDLLYNSQEYKGGIAR